MGILTGDITPTSGEAFVASNNVTGRTQDGVQLARQNIGFCPQGEDSQKIRNSYMNFYGS